MKNFLLILALFPAVTFAVDTDALITEREHIKSVLAATEDLAQSKEQIQKQVEEFKVKLNQFKNDWWDWDADSIARRSDCETIVMLNAGAPLTQAQWDQCRGQIIPIDNRGVELDNERKQLDLIKEHIQSLINNHGRRARMSQRLAEINSQLDGN